jgi:predicted transcriptional regulator
MSKPIMFRLDDALAAWLDAHCERTKLKRTQAITQALEDYRRKTEAEFRILEEAARRKR